MTIDLRSDTVTRPTAAMRAAMAAAEVGDDVYGEDPTVNRLEARAAEIFGREAAFFVPTGTMGNQIAIRLHTQHGQEVICESRGHVVDWEMAMVSAFSGVPAAHRLRRSRHRHLAAHRADLSRTGLHFRVGTGLIIAREHPQHGRRNRHSRSTYLRKSGPAPPSWLARASRRRTHLQRRHRARHRRSPC